MQATAVKIPSVRPRFQNCVQVRRTRCLGVEACLYEIRQYAHMDESFETTAREMAPKEPKWLQRTLGMEERNSARPASELVDVYGLTAENDVPLWAFRELLHMEQHATKYLSAAMPSFIPMFGKLAVVRARYFDVQMVFDIRLRPWDDTLVGARSHFIIRKP